MTRAALVVVLCGAATVARAQAGAQPVEGQGQARILNEDRVSARAKALDNAMRNAVERGFDTLVAADIRAAHPRAVRAAVGRARSLVDRYRVLSESENGGLYLVQIEASIDPGALLRALESEPGGPGPAAAAPALVLRGAEAWAEGAVRQALGEAGIKLALVAPATLTLQARSTEEGPVRGTDLVSVRVDLTGALTGAAPATLTATARGFAPDPAAARATAVRDSAADLGRAAGRALAPGEAAGGVPVQLTGRFGWRGLQAFTRALGALPGVAAVAPRRFGHGWVTVLVRTAQTPAELAARIARLAVPGLASTVQPGADGSLRVRLDPGLLGEPERAP